MMSNATNPWFWAFTIAFVLCVAWLIFREIQIVKLRREAHESQLLLKTIAKRISSARASIRKEFDDIRRLIVNTANQAQLDRIEVGLGKKNHGVRINIDGDVNQAGGEVNNR